MRIQHNIMAMSAYRNYTNNVSAMKKNLEKLSSGYKINRAGDDAAGLAISEKMRAQITGLETAQKNAKDGISLVQTAEGALTEVHDMLNRMVELATQSANGTYDNTTDRAQMQKEVNQLLSEIDRIADSSNFNGINLLDGSLGLNTDAVTNVKYLDAAAAATGKTISTVKVDDTTIHGANADSFQKPSVTIDLGDVKIKNTGTATATIGVTINIGSVALTVEMTNVGAGSEVTASAIANALTTKYTATATSASAATGGAIDIGGAFYKVTGSKGALKLELHGVLNAAGTAVEAITSTSNDKFTASMANAFTAKIDPGATVSIALAASATKAEIKNENSYIHGVTDYVGAKAEGDAHRWGADVTLSTDLMKDGAQLTIGVGTQTKTFTIAISSTATKSAVNGDTVTISTKEVGTSASAQLKKFVEVMEGESAGYFKISGKDPTTIHIDVRASVAASKVATWSTATIKNAVSAKEKDTAAHNAGVEFTLDDSKLTKGDVIKVGDNSFVYQGTGTNTFTSAADLKTKLAAVYSGTNPVQVATEAAGNGVKFTVYASTATKAAPMLQGRGLTLQIGDTADSFNQLNVAVQDMHAISLGVGGLNISDEVSAQQAIDKIKAAINKVSDVRGTLGATQNRLDHTINNLSVMTENIQDAESTIRDVDVAEEMMAYTKNNILIQSAQAMLAQANQVPQGVLQLLQ